MPPKEADNLAYDLSLFEERKREEKVQTKEEVTVKAAKAQRKGNTLLALKIVSTVLVIGFTVGLMLYFNAQIYELNDTINGLNGTLIAAQAEEVRLNVSLDQKISMENIEEYITEDLGMVKQEKYQMHYVDLSEGDKIVVAEKGGSDLWNGIKDFFEDIKEYFA